MLLQQVEYTGEGMVTASEKWSPQDFADTLMYGNAIPNNLALITSKCPDFRDAVLSIIINTEPDRTTDVIRTLANFYRSTPSTKATELASVTEYTVPLCFAKGELAAMLAFLKRNQKDTLGSLTVNTLHAYKQNMQSDIFKNLIIQSYDPLTSEWQSQVKQAFPNHQV